MKCEECGKKTKVCFRSNNKRYKIYICRECKSKEKNNAVTINKANSESLKLLNQSGVESMEGKDE